MYRTDNYQCSKVNAGGQYVIEEVKAHIYDLKILSGDAIVTHLGGNGRFAFTLDGKQYYTELTKNVCTDKRNHGVLKADNNYYTYEAVRFNVDVLARWYSLYTNSADYKDSNTYWKHI